MNFFLLLNTKDILNNMGNQTIDYYTMVWLPTFFKTSFVFGRRKKVIWNNLGVSK